MPVCIVIVHTDYMKEQLKSFSKLKNIAMAGVTALGLHQSAEAQNLPRTNNEDTATALKKGVDTAFNMPTFDIEELYRNNQESNDKQFNKSTIFDDTTENKTIIVEFKGPETMTVTVRSQAEDAYGDTEDEVFTTLDALGNIYPLYKSQTETWFDQAYTKHKMKIAWGTILREKKKILSNNFDSYVPSLDEMVIMEEEVALRNSGGNTDGLDKIYHFYVDELKTNEDTYRFYEMHDGTPESLAEYMKEKYFLPALNK